MKGVALWLHTAGLGHLYPRFQSAGVTESNFSSLSFADYDSLGVVDPAERKTLFKLISVVKGELAKADSRAPPPATPLAPAPAPAPVPALPSQHYAPQQHHQHQQQQQQHQQQQQQHQQPQQQYHQYAAPPRPQQSYADHADYSAAGAGAGAGSGYGSAPSPSMAPAAAPNYNPHAHAHAHAYGLGQGQGQAAAGARLRPPSSQRPAAAPSAGSAAAAAAAGGGGGVDTSFAYHHPAPAAAGGAAGAGGAAAGLAGAMPGDDADAGSVWDDMRGTLGDGGSKIRVIVRKRPLSTKERARGEIDIVSAGKVPQVCTVHEPKVKVDLTKYVESHKFVFDDVFGSDAENKRIYNLTCRPLIPFAIAGGKATCFAYGQTGSGKTFTMMGPGGGKQMQNGLYALAAADVFAQLQRPGNTDLQVWVSFFEIYGGKPFDLLNARAKLVAREDAARAVNIVGLKDFRVTTVQQMLELIAAGNAVRSTGVTGANVDSSRSHAIVQVQFKRFGTGAERKVLKPLGKFSFIDLAGSERGADTAHNDRGTRMEGAEINKSLLALKECIRALDQGGKHLPFRASTLTQVLKDSFIGNSRTIMIANISPNSSACEHTLNTLRYADRVKELKQEGQGGSGRDAYMPHRGKRGVARAAMPDDDDDEEEEALAAAAATGAAGGGGGRGMGHMMGPEGDDVDVNEILRSHDRVAAAREAARAEAAAEAQAEAEALRARRAQHAAAVRAAGAVAGPGANANVNTAGNGNIAPAGAGAGGAGGLDESEYYGNGNPPPQYYGGGARAGVLATPAHSHPAHGHYGHNPGHGHGQGQGYGQVQGQGQAQGARAGGYPNEDYSRFEPAAAPAPTAPTATPAPAPAAVAAAAAAVASGEPQELEKTYNDLCVQIIHEEEALMEGHRLHIDTTMRIVKQEMELMKRFDTLGHSVDEYITLLDDLLVQKTSSINALRDRLRALQNHLKEEEVLSMSLSMQRGGAHSK